MARSLTRVQEQVAAEQAAYTGEPTLRMQAAAAAIKKGTPVVEAMTAAGYGKRFILGHAKTFHGLLVEAGLMTEEAAAKVAKKGTGKTEGAAEDAAPDKLEMIRP